MENNSLINFCQIFHLNYLNLSGNISSPIYKNYLNNINDKRSDNVFMTLISGILPIYLRIGFILIQIGCTPTSNTNHIILQNIIDFAVATVSYCLIGSTLAFGSDFKGLIGSFSWKGMDNIDMNLFMYGWGTVMITTGIITTMFSGRMHSLSYILLSFLTAGLLQPMFTHWLWDKNGLLNNNTYQNYRISVIDNSGISNIHVCGGIIAFVGNLCFGRKLIRLKDIDTEYLASMPLTVTGYFLLISGLIANIPPSDLFGITNHGFYYARNNIIALSGGIIGTAVLIKLTKGIQKTDEWLITRYLQGGIMGMVTVSGGLYMYSPITLFVIGTLSSVILISQTELLLKSAFDDYCRIVPIHLTGGFVGLILPTLFMCRHFLTIQIFFIQLGWQLIAFLLIVITAIVSILPLFCLLKCLNILRNKYEKKNHNLVNNTAKQIPCQDFCL